MPLKVRKHGTGRVYLADGVKYISVTSALSEGLPKPALPQWAARTVAESVADMTNLELAVLRGMGRDGMVRELKSIPFKQRNDAAARGTKVHHFAELLVRGDEVSVPEELVGHVESCARFLDQWQVRPLLVERSVVSYAWGYAGTFDLIGELPDGRRVLFDYKTSKSGIWPETALQLAAYRYADAYATGDEHGTEIPMREVGITDTKAVWVRADGYDVIPLKGDDIAHKAFLHCLSVARFRAQMDTWMGAAELP